MWKSLVLPILVLCGFVSSLSVEGHSSDVERFDTALDSASSVVNLGYARYRAKLNSTTKITSFRGVRFAAPPTGNLRFQAPQPPGHTPGILDADTEPNACYKTDTVTGVAPSNPWLPKDNSSAASNLNIRRRTSLPRNATVAENLSEDCLFLDVHVPGSVSSNGKASYPVVVWIHGGGSGNGGAWLYDGSQLVIDSDLKAIVVVVQYRMGLFGFLPGSKVKADGVLNAGLLDQQFALKWVQSHISSFGGDPSRVTIWGESSGGGFVLQQVIANNGKTSPPLFKAAITSSAYIPSHYNYDDPIPEAIYSKVLAQTNCSTASDSLACLRAADISALSDANSAITAAGFVGTGMFSPVIDGEFITQSPTHAFASGRVNGHYLLSTTNVVEGSLLVDPSTTRTPAQYANQVFTNLTLSQADEVGEAYAKLGVPAVQQIQALVGEALIICPTYYAQAAFSGKSYKSTFAVSPGVHAQDIPYYFGKDFSVPGIPLPPPVDNQAFITSFGKSFLNFAISHDPNVHINSSDITPFWSKYSSKNRTEMIFNVTESDQSDIHAWLTDAGLVARCNLWHSLSSSTFQ